LLFILLGFIIPHSYNTKYDRQNNVPEKPQATPVTRPVTDSLDIKIGQMIIFGFYGTKIDKNEPVYKAVKEGKVGSILIYGRNITTQQTAFTLKTLIDGFQKAASIPLFVSIDQEGGLVNRLPQSLGFPSMPSAFFLGTKNDPAITKYYSDNIAFTLSRLGINLNYAPVLDLHNPNCPVLGARQRCFSDNPLMVTDHASIVISSHDYFKVHTVLKHFPGHGNSTTDSHLGVTDVTATWKWEELMPYAALIRDNKADAIMTAHIVNGRLDKSKRPATLSKPVITGLLRDSLGFKGVIFSDDMQMQAISSQYGLTESIQLAIDAGVDVLMFSNNIKGVPAYSPANVHHIIKQLVIKGKISPERIDASFRRIMGMKDKWRLADL
ncbi:MAG: glycoside hydrolase family 3 N-terminal domain-containing protein, partial [Chitinophagaceae bacterium]